MWVARGVMAAVELDVFEVLEGAGLPLRAFCERTGMPERSARGLLDLCKATGLVEEHAGRYRNTGDASRYLFSGSEYSVRNYALDERWCWGAWGRLDEALRTGAPTLAQDEDGYHTFPADYFLDFLHGHTLAMADLLAEAIDLSGVEQIMDVGGGSGATSIALCRANLRLRSIVVDQPPVLRKTAEHIERAGLTDRIRTHAVNIFEDALPSNCDAAVIANMLHDFSEEKARSIVRKVHDALPSGAPLIVMEMAPNDDRSAPALAVAFSLTMLVNTEGGDAYTIPQYRAWLDEAGFDVEQVVPLNGQIVTTAIRARKR